MSVADNYLFLFLCLYAEKSIWEGDGCGVYMLGRKDVGGVDWLRNPGCEELGGRCWDGRRGGLMGGVLYAASQQGLDEKLFLFFI